MKGRSVSLTIVLDKKTFDEIVEGKKELLAIRDRKKIEKYCNKYKITFNEAGDSIYPENTIEELKNTRLLIKRGRNGDGKEVSCFVSSKEQPINTYVG